MDYKVIVSGRLEFGNSRTFEQVVKLFEHRREVYYKGELLFKPEQLFSEASQSIDIPRYIGTATDKVWRNTVKLIQQIAEYAIAGDFNLWGIREGKPTEHWLVEPQGDKSAILAFREGRDLVREKGREEEAKAALSRAIEKFERHALAYERRGYVNFKLGNFDDAVYDYSKSIDINPNKPEAYFGRGIIFYKREDWKKAFADFELAVAKSIPHQSIHWLGRVYKANALSELARYEEAVKEYGFFIKRYQQSHDTLAEQLRRVAFNCGKCQLALSQHAEAERSFALALQSAPQPGGPSTEEILSYSQLCAQAGGDRTASAKPAARKGKQLSKV